MLALEEVRTGIPDAVLVRFEGNRSGMEPTKKCHQHDMSYIQAKLMKRQHQGKKISCSLFCKLLKC
jgi:hypothetical protein